MIDRVEPAYFLKQITNFLILDVRSPMEYQQGHIPGSVNIPLFSDSDRATIGTLYQKLGKGPAILRGLDICLPKIKDYLKTLSKISNQRKILIYCWRGGMRSTLMAEVFSKAGYPIVILNGGYQAYRKQIRSGFSNKAVMLVLGGFTGSGKTQLLQHIADLGEQVIDLEKSARHKGSVFGALGQASQPTNQQFENDLYQQWSEFDFSRPIWIEDESRRMGKLDLPDPLVRQISEAILIDLEVPVSVRVKRLVREYADFDKLLLKEAIVKLKERLGNRNTKEALFELESEHFEAVAEILLAYYDKTYRFTRKKRVQDKIIQVQLSSEDMEEEAKKLILLARKILFL